MTNERKIRLMSRWELAEFIYKVSNNAIKITDCNKDCSKCEYTDEWCISGIGEWLMKESDTNE